MRFVDINAQNREEVNAFLAARWFSTDMALRGELVDLRRADGIIALENGEIAGLLTYITRGDTCEITSLDSVQEGRGVGTALVERLLSDAKRRGCARVVVLTTNDNLNALRFYQRRGFDMARLYRGAVAASRALKPSIPQVGAFGIPIRHEIELELLLV